MNGALFRRIVAFLAAICIQQCSNAAVGADENLLLNGALEADQATLPPFWSIKGTGIEWKPSGGPGGKPCVSLSSSSVLKGERTFRQYGLRLAEGGRYRVSAYCRTKSFSCKSGTFAIVNNWWNKSAGVGKIPEDTGGKWVKMEQEFSCFPSDNGAYSAVLYAIDAKGEVAFADLRLSAVDPLAIEKTERSSVLSAQSDPRIIPFSPLLGRIPCCDPRIEFRFFGKLPKGTSASDFEVRIEADGVDGRTCAPLDTSSPMFVAIPGGDSERQGVFTASIVRKADGSSVFAERHRYAVRDIPGILKKGRRLNNLAYELVNERRCGEATSIHPFDVSRDGWIFIKADGGSTVRLDGAGVVSSATPRGETFRRVSAGRHKVEVSGAADRIIVRLIVDIFNYCPGANSHVKENGPYDWSFQEKYVLPAVTTQNGGSVPKERRADFLDRGYRWLANLGTSGVSAEKLLHLLKGAPGMTNDFCAGVTCDEQFLHRPNEIAEFTKGMAAYDLEALPEKSIYTWAVGKPFTKAVDERFFSTCLNVSLGNGMMLFEAYCRTKETEDEARRYLDGYVKDTIVRYRKTYPLSVGSTCIAFGNFNQVPILSLAHHPEVDFKYYLDMQLNMAANDPAFDGIGSVGYWGSYYADEELHRWSFALMRHYVVEGRKDMLSARYGFSYRPDHVLNGDFRGSLDPWRITGDVRADSFSDFAKTSQNRWGGNGGVGDTFAVLVRGRDSVATLRQTARGLVPGRKYRLRYATFDVKDVKAKRIAPRRFAVSASAGAGASVDGALTWTHVDRRIKGRYATNDGCARINLGQIVFTATAPETEVSFSNERAEAGEELGVNYVSILPYYPAR